MNANRGDSEGVASSSAASLLSSEALAKGDARPTVGSIGALPVWLPTVTKKAHVYLLAINALEHVKYRESRSTLG
jgi:hypothetical protein